MDIHIEINVDVVYMYFSEKSEQDKVKGVIEHIIRLQDYIVSMQQLRVTQAEYAYLKLLVLFYSGQA